MADRAFHPSYRALELEVVHIYAKATIGATGAPTLVSAASKGVASIARNSAGQYTLTLSDKYNSLLWGNVALVSTADSDAATVGVAFRLEAEDVVSAKTVQFQAHNMADGAVADPASGAVLLIKLELKNTSV